jgi:hypothetical protein
MLAGSSFILRLGGRWHAESATVTPMIDLLFIAATLAFFAISALYACFCDSL